MVEKGFSHEELNAMTEDEFLYFLDARIVFDKLVAEAAKNK